MALLSKIFVWWKGSTIGTDLFTRRNGERVGEDSFGNVYYRNADDTKRWVIYADLAEASAVTPDWHGWLHHTFELPPTEAPLKRWDWEAEAKMNMTGTDDAYRPPGSLLNAGDAAKPATKSYSAWTPE